MNVCIIYNFCSRNYYKVFNFFGMVTSVIPVFSNKKEGVNSVLDPWLHGSRLLPSTAPIDISLRLS